jgi:tetratricopeptide (TPR) repeat protein
MLHHIVNAVWCALPALSLSACSPVGHASPPRAVYHDAVADSTDRAADMLRDAIALDPGDSRAAILLSKLYYETRAHGAAVAVLEGVLQKDADAPDAVRVALAMHLDALGDTTAAREALNACRGDDDATAFARDFLDHRNADSHREVAAARSIVRRNPGSAAAQNNYGTTLLRAGYPGDARRAFKTALAIDADLPVAMYNLAVVETFYFFDHDAGRRWFDRYRRLASEDPDNLASILDADVARLFDAAAPE